jgi:iron complex transport system substrate-binding protein
MPCGFTLSRTLEEFGHVTLPKEWSGLRAVRSGRVYAVNGSAYFNRPGPRILTGLQILAEIIHRNSFDERHRQRRGRSWANECAAFQAERPVNQVTE